MGAIARYIFMNFFFIKDSTAYKIELLINNFAIQLCLYVFFLFWHSTVLIQKKNEITKSHLVWHPTRHSSSINNNFVLFYAYIFL